MGEVVHRRGLSRFMCQPKGTVPSHAVNSSSGGYHSGRRGNNTRPACWAKAVDDLEALFGHRTVPIELSQHQPGEVGHVHPQVAAAHAMASYRGAAIAQLDLVFLPFDLEAEFQRARESGLPGAEAKLAAEPLQQELRLEEAGHVDLAPLALLLAAAGQPAALGGGRPGPQLFAGGEDLVEGAVGRGVQHDAVLIVLDGIAAGVGQQLGRHLGASRRGDQFHHPMPLEHDVSHRRGADFFQVPEVGAVQGDVDLVEGLPSQQPLPIGQGAVQGAVAAGEILPIDPHQGPFFPTPPGADVQPAVRAVPMPPQPLVQQPGQHGAGGGLAATRAGRTGPSRRGGKNAECWSAAGRPGPRPRRPAAGPRRASSSPALAPRQSAAVSQPLQPGHGDLVGAELHHPMGQLHVGHQPAGTLQQQPVAGFVEGIGQRDIEFAPRRAREDRRQEAADRLVIAGTASHDRSSAPGGDTPLLSASVELHDVTAALICANPFSRQQPIRPQRAKNVSAVPDPAACRRRPPCLSNHV